MEQIVVITGAADGLGKAFATRFAEEGYQVVAADINDEAGESLVTALSAHSGKVVYRHCDVTQKDQVQALVSGAIDQFGTVHVLINNAVPPSALAPLEEKSDEAFQRQLDGGFFAARWAMNAAFDSMKAAGFGRIINLCSLNGVNAHPQTADYNIAKEALRCLTRSAAREWAPHGIRSTRFVLALSPQPFWPCRSLLRKWPRALTSKFPWAIWVILTKTSLVSHCSSPVRMLVI